MSTNVKEKLAVREVVFSYAKMTAAGISATLAAIIIAAFFNRYLPASQRAIKLVEYIGYLGWAATLGNGVVSSWIRNTSAELLDRRLLVLFSLMGVFAFVLARELIPVAP